jgi:putative acetyltransferase
MALPPDFMRPARPEDFDAIDALLRAAFSGPEEAALVRDLRAVGAMELEMVMPSADGLAAHLALSRMVAPSGWLALAPVVVAPVWQGKRIGSRLVAGVVRLMAIKGVTVVVLGKPSFYARAGFSVARAARLISPYPLDHLCIIRPGTDAPAESLVYPAAFEGVLG